ncbi:hypothetical protein K3X48_01205 [Aliiroseovarius crassostreae]|uniref:Uncharacterized protein n=1 Tax=Aliiroseovarius crassostreae TaxID=154981 RepID=A0A9Q9LXJ8_9RHOB|nr:hypothetical protein [Aliiroseovarius crassostreae]UWP95657.1 hypothetical protein K3X48_01205 [Aliiroseovarius crassostreae]
MRSEALSGKQVAGLATIIGLVLLALWVAPRNTTTPGLEIALLQGGEEVELVPRSPGSSVMRGHLARQQFHVAVTDPAQLFGAEDPYLYIMMFRAPGFVMETRQGLRVGRNNSTVAEASEDLLKVQTLGTFFLPGHAAADYPTGDEWLIEAAPDCYELPDGSRDGISFYAAFGERFRPHGNYAYSKPVSYLLFCENNLLYGQKLLPQGSWMLLVGRGDGKADMIEVVFEG